MFIDRLVVSMDGCVGMECGCIYHVWLYLLDVV